jgi:hypothetical protein
MRPIRKVPPEIRMTVRARIRCRPMRSPSVPKTAAPKGRITNGTMKTANALNVCAAGSWAGKKLAPTAVTRYA